MTTITTTSDTHTAANSAVDSFLSAVAGATIPDCDAWSDHAVLDATVPNWRMHRYGPDAIRAEYSGWFADAGQFEHLHRVPIPGGELLEYDLTWVQEGVPHAAHHVHLLQVEDDRIVRDTVVCGGRWPAALLAQMEASDDQPPARHAGG